MSLNLKKIKLSDILKILNLKLKLKENPLIKNVSNIDSATKGDITLCLNSKYLTFLDKTKASACIINKNFLKRIPKNCIPLVSENPHIDFIKVSNLFYGDFVVDKITKTYLKSNQIKSKFKKIFLVIILFVKMVSKLEKM